MNKPILRQIKKIKHLSNETKESDIRDRYWTYLFENLKRAVDEIYQTCEHDKSISDCKVKLLFQPKIFIMQLNFLFLTLESNFNDGKLYKRIQIVNKSFNFNERFKR